MKKVKWIVLSFFLFMGIFTVNVLASEQDNDQGIDEKHGLPRVVYGDALSESQQEEVRRLLGVTDRNTVQEYTVTAADLVEYIGGDSSSNMYSSAKITRKNDGHGIVVQIVTDDNITQVTNDMYANAMLTAGVENADVKVVSPVRVSGHSALTGIYKAFNVDGESLDQDRMEVANEELELATDLAELEDVDQESVTELLTQIKQKIAEQNPVSREEVEQIVREQLDNLNIELSPADIERLANLFDKMRSINIDFSQVSNQLQDIAKSIQNKLDEITGDTGFWEAVKSFFKSMIDGIRNLFS
ncbi:uncharacterized protein YpuA (DUF1002 family) [Natronobacillus azotifigens]|uniref:DUF1002 domain-containing protein n=1 Tax=Natronobacillus azotifigens TaxID=472978 RepID=A0A9J6RB61_9BACI|nr:DUF1002 domain-containing protein [Natronobacillus azotifigens]MCZ0702473.1 DUF1002 domain-containing protein [Natronobacillus azotifigens]